MKCNKCNAELLDETLFCPYCGTKTEYASDKKEPEVEILNSEPKVETPSEAGCWAKFAQISNILGTITISTFWIPFFGLFSMFPGIPGIVFGGLGKNSKIDDVKPIAESGFIKSLIGTILSIVSYFVWVFIIIYTSV